VGDPFGIDIFESLDELFKDGSSHFFWELLCLVDEAIEFAILFDFHDIVENALDLSVDRAVDPTDIEVNDLNYITMMSIMRHLHLVQKLLEGLQLVPSFALCLLDLLVHYLDGHTFIGHHINRHLHPVLTHKYFEKRPDPSLKTTRYFSSITGHRSRYYCGSSRIQFIV
jgi:hypothetical protein